VLVAYTCNLTYLGGNDWNDHGSRPAQAKKMFTRFHLNRIKAGCHHVCHLHNDEKLKIESPSWPRKKVRP
jgi:hypothetical protein